MKRILRIVLVCVCAAVFAFSAGQLVKTGLNYRKAQKSYESLQQQYVMTTQPPVGENREDEPTESGKAPEQTQPPKPSAPITVDFSALLERNRDTVGWLYSPDTPIHYPVVQARDNAEYLYTGLDGQYLMGGTLFADYRNGAVGTDSNYIIYGHNMKDSSMFGTLENYKKQAYYDAHPVMYFLTPEGDYTVELYAGFLAEQDDALYSLDGSPEAISALLARAKRNSTFSSSVEIGENDLLLTFSTCAYEFDGARYILIGRLVPL